MTITEKLTKAVLNGRKIAAKKPAAPDQYPAPEQSRETLRRFAALMADLASARDEMDEAVKLAQDAKGLDLSQLLLDGKELPDLVGLASRAESSKLRVAALRQALDRLTDSAAVALYVLRQAEGAFLQSLEQALRQSMERPKWMSPEEFDIQVLKSNGFGKIAMLRDAPKPRIPMLLGDGGKRVLKHFRIEPRSAQLNSFGPSEDQLDPEQLSQEITSWLEQLQRVEAMAVEGVQSLHIIAK